MPIQVEWINSDQTILLYTYSDPFTVDDILAMEERVALMIPEERTVPAIIDARQIHRLPTTLLASYPLLAQHSHETPIRIDPVLCVIDNYFVEQIASIYDRLYRHFQIVRTMEVAVARAEESLEPKPSAG